MSQPDADADTQTLADAFEVRGDWWLPRSPDLKVAGTLKFDPAAGARLELMGSLAGPHTLEFGVYQVILGEGLDGIPVTLTGCAISSLPPHVLQMGRLACDYAPTAVFRGSHFPSIENITLSSLRVSYDCLPAWMQLNAVKETAESRDVPTVSFLQKGNDSHNLDAGTLTFHVWPEVRRNHGSFSISARACVEFTPKQPLHYDDLRRDFVYPMQNLLSLGMDTEARPLNMSGTVPTPHPGGETVSVSYADYFHTMLRPQPIAEQPPAVFGLQSLAADATKYLANWFRKAAHLRPVCDLFFGVAHHPLMYTSLRFLSYCQALETYHRGSHDGVYMSKGDFAEVLAPISKAVPAGLPADLQDNIQSRLRHSYEFSFRDRLRQLLGELWPQVKLGFRGASGNSIVDAERLVDLIVRTRNGLTHKGTIPEDVKDEHIWHASQLLKMLIESVLLTEMGVTPEQLRLFVGPTRYLHSFDALAREFPATSEPSEFGGQ